MSGVNKVILIGHLGRDPEIRRTQSGEQVAIFSVATGDTWKDRETGERRERTEWHNVVTFNEQLVKVASEYLKKGSKVYLEGQNRTRKWQDKKGIDRSITEVVLPDFIGKIVLLDRVEREPSPERGAYEAESAPPAHDEGLSYENRR